MVDAYQNENDMNDEPNENDMLLHSHQIISTVVKYTFLTLLFSFLNTLSYLLKSMIRRPTAAESPSLPAKAAAPFKRIYNKSFTSKHYIQNMKFNARKIKRLTCNGVSSQVSSEVLTMSKPHSVFNPTLVT